MTTTDQPTSYNDLKRLAGEALAQAVTDELFDPLNATRFPYRSANMPYLVWK